MNEQCPIPKILIAVDDSESSQRAIEHIACIASKFKSISNITLLHVDPASDKAKWVLDEGVHGDVVDQVDRIRKDRFNKLFEEAEAILEGHGIKKGVVKRKTKIGDPAKEIIKEAKRGEYTTIVLGKKSKSKIDEIFVGSVTKTVIDKARNFDIYVVE
ncbi:MAG: universal stress protein [Candidatus Hydrothermarchaeaceae archaeon]